MTTGLRIYVEPRDAWVGAYVARDAVYVCPLPFLVFRWQRAAGPEPEADPLLPAPPKRDPSSTTSCGTDRRATRTARDPAAPPPPVSGGAFGFGLPEVTA